MREFERNKNGETKMKVTYIFHSGFFVETDCASLLFDYYRGPFPAPSAEKPLYIFSSHSHGDHVSTKIFDFAKKTSRDIPGACVHYLLSDDISPGQIPKDCKAAVTFLEPDRSWADDLVSVQTLRSNDLGIAFVVDIGGIKIYHAGDLNNWWWDGDREDEKLADHYHRELEKIRGMHFDAAFIPLDPRIKGYQLGIEDFLLYADADRIFPMHFGTHFEIIDQFLDRPEGKDYSGKIVRIRQENQIFTF